MGECGDSVRNSHKWHRAAAQTFIVFASEDKQAPPSICLDRRCEFNRHSVADPDYRNRMKRIPTGQPDAKCWCGVSAVSIDGW